MPIYFQFIDPEKGFDLVPYYVGAIALALLIIGCVGVCVSYYHYKKADKINRVHTIRVKEKKQEHINRESSSGVFSYGMYTGNIMYQRIIKGTKVIAVIKKM